MPHHELFWNRNCEKELKRQRFVRGEPRDVFLIVCEGEKTEPNYFRSFPATNTQVEVIGAGATPERVVEEAIKYKRSGQKYRKFDQVWCVFDKDSNPPQNFNAALELAKRNGINIAYSNEAFELWFVLHYDFLDTGISRYQYIDILKDKLGGYQKNDPKIYEKLLERQQAAIKNASNLLARYNPLNPCRDNPSTTVHKLVLELKRFS